MANPTVPSLGPLSLVDASALLVDYGLDDPSAYATGGGAEASLAAGVLQAEDDITALEAAVGALKVDAESAAAELVVPLGSLRASTGDAIPAFTDNTTDGFSLVGSECLGIRWNDSGSTRATVAGEAHIPADWDDAKAITLHFEGFRVGEVNADMVGTVTLFAQEIGDAYNADADAGGSTTAFNGATNVITDETLAVSAGVLPAGSKVSFTFVPDAALDGDDFVLTGIRFVGTRKMRAA
jgi:hypothetical protein